MKRVAVCLLSAAVFASAPAWAAPNPGASTANAGAAKDLFDEGVKLAKAGQFTDALDRLQRSHELVPSVGALVQISECFKALDKPASAWGALNEAEMLAVRVNDPRLPQVRELVAKAKQQLQVAHLTLTVPKIEGLTVTRNGQKVDPATFDTDVPIDHGSYTIEASAPGRKPWTGKLEVAPAASAKLTIPNLDVVAAPEPTTPADDAPSTQRTVGIALEIGGGAILAAGLVFGALTFGSWGTVEEKCPGGQCGSEDDKTASQSARDRASTFGAISTVGVIVGGAALAGGIVLHLTAPRKQSGMSLRPTIGQGAYGLSFTFAH
ncbi:MAG: hypothetical protein U0270_36930 [Labilithrix sp.]